MRPLLGLLLLPVVLLSLLAGCGDDMPSSYRDPDTTQDSAQDSTQDSSGDEADDEPSNGPVDFRLVGIASETSAGGEVEAQPVDLSDAAATEEFLAQFTGDRMASAVAEQMDTADVADGETLLGSVVAIGCMPPEEVTVERTDAGLRVEAVVVKTDTHVECFAPVTSVAVVAVDADLV